MSSADRRPTPLGHLILDRLEAKSWSSAELERRSGLTKNTISNAIYGPRRPQRKTVDILAGALELPVEDLTAALGSDDGTESTETDGPVPDGPVTVRFERFGDWLWRRGNLSLWILLAGALVTAAMLVGGRTPGAELAPWQVHTVHALVLAALLLRLPRPHVGPRLEEDGPDGLPIALTAAADLRARWGPAWAFWLVLYLLLAVGTFVDPTLGDGGEPTHLGRWLTVAFNLAQNVTTVMLFLVYEVVARPTVEADLSRKQVLPPEGWLMLALLPTVLEAGSLWLGHPWLTQQSFGWISGFAQGTALALLAGRLDSKYIDPPTPLIAGLYVYAAIQGAWPVFQSHPDLMRILTFLALVLKGLLFLLFEWLFESRVLLFYLQRLRVLNKEVRQSRRQFLGEVQ